MDGEEKKKEKKTTKKRKMKTREEAKQIRGKKKKCANACARPTKLPNVFRGGDTRTCFNETAASDASARGFFLLRGVWPAERRREGSSKDMEMRRPLESPQRNEQDCGGKTKKVSRTSRVATVK